MAPTLTIDRFMTPTPQTIGVDMSLAVAHRMMRERRIRHLPVLQEGKLVGIVSERDLALVETMRGVDPEDVTVADAMSPEPYQVAPAMPIAEVAREMAEHRYGAAVIVDGQRVVGIFTTVDAMTALLFALEKNHEPRARPRGAAARRRKSI
jgi:acetoin utilization protein AcuB